jgi:hypothetical protein
MDLGSTQSLTEISTRSISWGVKAAGAQGWQPYYIYVPKVWKYESLDLVEPYKRIDTFIKRRYKFLLSSIENWVENNLNCFLPCFLS